MRRLTDRRPQGRPPHPDVLTPAEWRVLDELRAGLTNAEIAARLGISVNTVRSHVSTMLAKLELRHRHELAAWRGEPLDDSGDTSLRHAIAAPFLWLRDGLTSPALAQSAIVLGVAGLSIAAVVGLASVSGGEDDAAPGAPDVTAGEPAALPELPRANVSAEYDPARFSDLAAVLYERQDPEASGYRPVSGVAFFDPLDGELVATVDTEGGGMLARRRGSAGELLLTSPHPDSGPYPDEILAELLVLDANDGFALKRSIDLPRALTATRPPYAPTSFVLSANEQHLFYLRYERRAGTTAIMSVGIVDLDARDPGVTVVSLPRNCGGHVVITPAGEDGAVALCGQIHEVFLLAPDGEIVAREDFRDAGIEHHGFAFGFLAPHGGLGAVTHTGVVYTRDPEGDQQQIPILPSATRVHQWSDPVFTPEGTVVLGTHEDRTDGKVEGLVEFDLESLAVLREMSLEPARSLALRAGQLDGATVLTITDDLAFPVDRTPRVRSVSTWLGTGGAWDGEGAYALLP